MFSSGAPVVMVAQGSGSAGCSVRVGSATEGCVLAGPAQCRGKRSVISSMPGTAGVLTKRNNPLSCTHGELQEAWMPQHMKLLLSWVRGPPLLAHAPRCSTSRQTEGAGMHGAGINSTLGLAGGCTASCAPSLPAHFTPSGAAKSGTYTGLNSAATIANTTVLENQAAASSRNSCIPVVHSSHAFCLGVLTDCATTSYSYIQ